MTIGWAGVLALMGNQAMFEAGERHGQLWVLGRSVWSQVRRMGEGKEEERGQSEVVIMSRRWPEPRQWQGAGKGTDERERSRTAWQYRQ